MISLLNKTRRPEIINLSHADVCKSGCSCVTSEHRQLVHNRRTGEVAVKVIPRQISGSVHLLPGIWSGPLSDDVLKVGRIVTLLKTKKVLQKAVESTASTPAEPTGHPGESLTQPVPADPIPVAASTPDVKAAA